MYAGRLIPTPSDNFSWVTLFLDTGPEQVEFHLYLKETKDWNWNEVIWKSSQKYWTATFY